MSQGPALPSDVQQSLTRVFQSVCIVSSTSFAFPSTPPTESVAPVQAFSAEERQRLVIALRDLLYSRCFARSLNGAKLHPPETLIPADDFCRRLSAANQGRDEWLSGWRVQEVRPGGVVVITQGERQRIAKAGGYTMTFAEEVPLCIGCAVTLRLRKESLALQEGTYCALGEESPSLDDEVDVVRIYFNATQEAAISLIELVTRHLNEWRVPFTLKIMLQPHDRDRSDATVLYLPKNGYWTFVRLLERFPASLFSLLREEVPLLTKRLYNGIGLAESPPGAESFGINRCRLIAEGIVDAWLDARQDVNARIQATEQRLISEGCSLALPYLNPGSEDIYSTRIEDRSPTQKNRRIVEQPVVLGVTNIVAFLRERGLCAAKAEGEGAWHVSEYPSRNRNFGVIRSDGGQGFFVKQLRVHDPESFRMMQCEANVYQLAQRDPDFAALRELAPQFFDFENDSKVIILEFIKAESLMQTHLRLQQFPFEFGQSIGSALATLHQRVGRRMSGAPPQEIFARKAPGIFAAHRNGPLVRWLGAGQMLLITQLRESPRLAQGLDELAASWRHDTFIHGDIKFENCMTSGPVPGELSRSGSLPKVIFVDWELADFGEASWDVGSVLQAYLSLCLRAAPAPRGVSLGEQLNHSTMPVDTLRSAIQHFWRSYCEEIFLHQASRRALVERSLQCAAARMFQTALEVMHGQARPTPLALTLLDASVELMTRTSHIAELLGLDEV